MSSQVNFGSHVNMHAHDALIEKTLDLSLTHPQLFYIFMQRYVQFNAFAGSLIATLAGAYGMSPALFRKETEVEDQADQCSDIAAKIFEAAIDEHCDSGCKTSHRALAQALLSNIGDYAGLSSAQRNSISKEPAWLTSEIAGLVEGYTGQRNNLKSLVEALGFHIGSEILADREYTSIDKIVRHDFARQGYDAYLRMAEGKITVHGKRLTAWYWIVIHGKYGSTGVEFQHAQCALEAFQLVQEFSTEPSSLLQEWAVKGFLRFHQLQKSFFEGAVAELESNTLLQAQFSNRTAA